MHFPRWLFGGLAAALLGAPAGAWESDVHYGLTKWLALQAGFATTQAEWIAVANQRVDGGLIDTMAIALEYACVDRHTDAAQLAQRQHFPAATAVPALPEDRVVVAGGPAARAPLEGVMAQAKGHAGLMLLKLGEALHVLQDSWAHQGAPSTPQMAGLACDPLLASGRPAARGGPDTHDADLTHRHPDDALAMARATYDALRAYPPVQGRERAPRAWSDLEEPLRGLLRGATKSAKRQWFAAQGLPDPLFLAGTSLPDGADPGPQRRVGDKLPPLPQGGSRQHGVAPDLLAFYDELLRRWLGPEPIDKLAAELGPDLDDAPASARPSPAGREVAARLKLWKLADHGTAAALAHAAEPLGAAQLREVDRLTRDGRGFVQTTVLDEALFPLQPSGPQAHPLLPYVVRPLPGEGGRQIAILRLRHAPHEGLGWIAERRAGRWALVQVVSVID